MKFIWYLIKKYVKMTWNHLAELNYFDGFIWLFAYSVGIFSVFLIPIGLAYGDQPVEGKYFLIPLTLALVIWIPIIVTKAKEIWNETYDEYQLELKSLEPQDTING